MRKLTGFSFTIQKFVASKTKAALDGGLGVILCCGESLEVCRSSHTPSYGSVGCR